jgi:Prp8 binding protein
VQLTGHEGEIFSCKFSPDGSILASSGFDRKIFLWNVYGECENWATLQGHGGAILDLKFNKDGSEFVTCSTDKSISIWDLNSLERIKKVKGHTEIVNSVDVCKTSPNLMCSASDDTTVKLWDRRKRGEAMSFTSDYQVLTCCFNENGEQIVSGGIDNYIKVWDVKKNGMAYAMKGHTDSVTGVSLSPDGNYVASNAMDNTGRCFFLGLKSRSYFKFCISFFSVRLWDIRPFAPQERGLSIFFGHSHNFEKVS